VSRFKPYWKDQEYKSKCVIGLDRDGVINRDLGTYCTRPEDFEPIPGSMEAMADLRRRGHKIVILTDQSGIGKGICTEADVNLVHQYMFELLGKAGCTSIDALYFSSSGLKTDDYVKPNVGMFKRCERENPEIKFNTGYYVGDKIKDLKAAMTMGAIPVLVRTGHGLETEIDLKRYAYREIKKRVLIFDNLAEFARSLE
jgi:D-glycero-D-manno-heptose 1,7-bisphosphate phosphatase